MAPFTLRPLTTADIGACAQLAGLAFVNDRQTQFKAANPTDPYDHVEGMKGGLRHWLSSASTEVTVAIDQATREIIGWVAWGFRGFDADGSHPPQSLNIEAVRGLAPPPDPALLNDTTRSSRARLEAYTSSDLQLFMKTLMPAASSKCMFVASIVVHPSHQGRGIGKAFLSEGTDRADGEGVYAWVHASEGGAGMFERCGFEEVRSLELDLDEWNSEGLVPPEGEGVNWGGYVLRYMVREPVATAN